MVIILSIFEQKQKYYKKEHSIKANVFKQGDLNYSRNILNNCDKDGLLQSCNHVYLVLFFICNSVVNFF